MNERVLVLDFGSQYNQLIIRKIRELGVYAELRAGDWSIENILSWGPSALVLSGGPASVYDDDSPKADPGIWELGLPILGICYGMQLMVQNLGGEIKASHKREYGKAKLDRALEDSLLFSDLEVAGMQVWMSHGDSVAKLPQGFSAIASTPNTPCAAMQNVEKRWYGLQFHPEVVHSINGKEILARFLYKVVGLGINWKMSNYVEQASEKVRDQVGADKVILGLSGGVDSSVMAALLDRCIGKQLTCVFVDNGLLRLNEREAVEKAFSSHHDFKLVTVDAADKFLGELKGVSDPEQKRKIIGRVFVEVFEEQVQLYPGAKWLAQGTIYPDVIESMSTYGKSVTIKSHHNVGGLPERMNLKVLEPLRELFKDEVRALGRELGLPEAMVMRHPFPGPGLGVRVIGEVSAERCDILRQADHIFLEEIVKFGLYQEIAQAFAVLLPVYSVGVMGDGRTYENVLALRAVTTTDFMTADWYRFPDDFLALVSNRIINEVRGVNRVVLDITSKPPGTIEWE